jgi:membrane-bound metal-dependent hydrolase YbcI (DUF457 family)
VAARWPRKDWSLFGAVVVSALLPDADFVIGPFAGQNYHHYFTHSLGFAALFFGAVYLFMRAVGRTAPLGDASVMTAAYLTHILMDLLANDTDAPFGVQLLWPFSDAFFISPVKAFPAIWRGSFALLFGPHNWTAVGVELLVLLPIVGFFLWLRRRGPNQLE